MRRTALKRTTSLSSGNRCLSNKHHALKTRIGGHLFDSTLEAARFIELWHKQKDGAISDLRIQVMFRLDMSGEKLGKYYADFVYEAHGETIVEDTKGQVLGTFKLKKGLMKAIHGIDVQIVKKNHIPKWAYDTAVQLRENPKLCPPYYAEGWRKGE